MLPAFSFGVWFSAWQFHCQLVTQVLDNWPKAMATLTIFICHPLRMDGPCLGLALDAGAGADLAGTGFGSGRVLVALPLLLVP